MGTNNQSYVVDNIAPTFAITSPVSGTIVVTGSVTISGTTDTAFATITLLLKNIANTFSTTYTTTADSLGNWIKNITGLTSDSSLISGTAKDAVNNVSLTGHSNLAVSICGNLSVNPGETCDDGNTIAGDGCSAVCTLETGYVCSNGPLLGPCLTPGTGGLSTI